MPRDPRCMPVCPSQGEIDLEASEDVRDAKGRSRESMKTEMVSAHLF